MLFDEAGVLPDRLRDGTCTLAAQDDSFFAYYFTEPDFAARFDPEVRLRPGALGHGGGPRGQRASSPARST